MAGHACIALAERGISTLCARSGLTPCKNDKAAVILIWLMCRDEDWGFQLYQSDPSGNYGGWKATAIGANKQAAQNLLKQDYEEDITLEKAIKLVIKV